jgi:hypothetical protein
MGDDRTESEARLEQRSIELQEGQQPSKPFVKSLFSSVPSQDPFGDRLSVVQELPDSQPEIAVPQPDSPSGLPSAEAPASNEEGD